MCRALYETRLWPDHFVLRRGPRSGASGIWADAGKYLNTLRLKESPTYQHQVATYGNDFDYYEFAKTFNEKTKQWEPETWAAPLKKTGARYAVLTTKHHDGLRLWPSDVTNPHANGRVLSAKQGTQESVLRSDTKVTYTQQGTLAVFTGPAQN